MKFIFTSIFIMAMTICKGQEDNYSRGLKAFDAKEYEKAMELLKPYADSGRCLAQYVVGFGYSNDNLSIANDSIAEIYLLLAAEQKQTHAMGILATLYFKKSYSENSYKIKALVWSELAAEYDPIQRGLSTRYVIRQYMNKEEIEEADAIIEKRKNDFKKMNNCT